MHLNLLAFAVPLFIFFMFLEYYVSIKKGKKFFHFNEAVANVNVGIAERLGDLFVTGLFYYFFSWIYENYALFTIRSGVITWIGLFLLTDFVWYWYHRCGHKVNLFWSVHVVHHQSEDFNYTASVRITVLQAAARCLFWSFLPLFGFNPAMISVMLLIHGAYPFFTHTQVIGKLGWLEYVSVTPSHHRVHHSSNEVYLDKNYGDVLIIWDKMFGTFKKEDEQPVYGLTTPLKSYSFLWQHFHFILEMYISFKKAGTFKEKLKVIFGQPSDINPAVRTYLERKLLSRETDKTPSVLLTKNIFLQTIFTLLSLFFLILFEHYQNTVQLIICALFILISIINTGAMLEQKKWIFMLDFLRVLLLILYLNTYGFYPRITSTLLLLMGFVLAYYKTVSNRYYKLIYQRAN